MLGVEYSVVIRTLGTAGEKYQALLDSIAKQTIKPKEVIVVIPYGYELPKEQLGYETFVRSNKGMVVQRIVGSQMVKTEYCLFVDDDVCFESSFVEKMAEPIILKKAFVTFPIFREMLPQAITIKLITACLGTALPFESGKNFTRVTRSGGYSYNPSVYFSGCYNAETAPGTCFFCKKETMQDVRFEEEVWLERTAYPLPEDQVMFYKFHKLGFYIMGVANVNFIHLDAGRNDIGRTEKASFAMACNKTIFWHRFIWKTDHNLFSKFWSLCCFFYSVMACLIYGFIKACVSRNFSTFIYSLKGYKQAYCFLKSDEYKQIPSVIK